MMENTIERSSVVQIPRRIEVQACRSSSLSTTSHSPLATQCSSMHLFGVFLLVLLAFPCLVSSLTLPCSYSNDKGIRYDNLIHLREFYDDYHWTGYDTSRQSQFNIAVSVCRWSASNAACARQWGSVCVSNLTSIESHLRNETWPTDLIVAGRYDSDYSPSFAPIDSSDADAGLKLDYHNGLPMNDPYNAIIYLHCEPSMIRYTNITAGFIDSDAKVLEFHLASAYACPTYYPPGPFRLNWWQILLICIGCVSVAYVLGGCLYKSLVLNTPTGWESFPNIKMWRSLPMRISVSEHAK